MSKLIRWETPFVNAFFPSVILINLVEVYESKDLLTIIVAPDGIDKYPKYSVKFERVIAFVCMEEAYAPERYFPDFEAEKNICSFQWIDSPWLESYKNGAHFIAGGHSGPFFHFLIFGGDNNVEVITPNAPTIKTITEKTTIKVEINL